MEPPADMPNKTNGTTRSEKRYWKFKKTLDMLNIILHSAEKTMNKPEAKAKDMTQFAARRNDLLEDTNSKSYRGESYKNGKHQRQRIERMEE